MQNSPQLVEIVDDLPKIAGRVYHIELCRLSATGRLVLVGFSRPIESGLPLPGEFSLAL
jgi:hypothetical protein